jgi:eukaryotic-like serine/threonine-protein kinase
MNLSVGTQLQAGRYTLEQELGSGGLGIIFRATYHALQRTVVIKTLNQSLDQHPQLEDFKLKFQDEARRLAACTHPNIVRFHDFFIEDDCPFLVMDYIPGQTLAEKVVSNRSPLPEATAIDYMRQIASALEVVHQLGMLHRDIKPGNIMVREDSDQVVLIDFGIAREFSGLPQTHTRMISEGYAPIEQYLIKSKRTPATDVYGLAATLYTLLTAKVPVASILRDREPMPCPRDYQPYLSQAVDRAVMRGMALEIHDRPQSITEWLALLPGSETELTSEFRTIQQILTVQQADPLLVVRQSTLQKAVGVGLGVFGMIMLLSGWASSFQRPSISTSSVTTLTPSPLPKPSNPLAPASLNPTPMAKSSPVASALAALRQLSTPKPASQSRVPKPTPSPSYTTPHPYSSQIQIRKVSPTEPLHREFFMKSPAGSGRSSIELNPAAAKPNRTSTSKATRATSKPASKKVKKAASYQLAQPGNIIVLPRGRRVTQSPTRVTRRRSVSARSTYRPKAVVPASTVTASRTPSKAAPKIGVTQRKTPPKIQRSETMATRSIATPRSTRTPAQPSLSRAGTPPFMQPQSSSNRRIESLPAPRSTPETRSPAQRPKSVARRPLPVKVGRQTAGLIRKAFSGAVSDAVDGLKEN